MLAKLELEFDLQDKIVKAALKLAHDATVSKGVRKQRRQSYHKSHQKVMHQGPLMWADPRDSDI